MSLIISFILGMITAAIGPSLKYYVEEKISERTQ